MRVRSLALFTASNVAQLQPSPSRKAPDGNPAGGTLRQDGSLSRMQPGRRGHQPAFHRIDQRTGPQRCHRDDLDSELRELRCVLCTETGVKDDCQKLVILVCAVDNSLEILFQYTNSLPVRILEDQSILDAVSGKINDMWFNVFNLLFQLMNLATLQSIQTVFLAIPGFIDGSVDLVQFTSDVKLIPIGKTRTDEK